MQKTIGVTTEVLEILDGLKASKKQISSKYFYDAEGSRIFQQIMGMPEYYLTDSEAEIFETHKRDISDLFCKDCCTVDLVELGAGDGSMKQQSPHRQSSKLPGKHLRSGSIFFSGG